MLNYLEKVFVLIIMLDVPNCLQNMPIIWCTARQCTVFHQHIPSKNFYIFIIINHKSTCNFKSYVCLEHHCIIHDGINNSQIWMATHDIGKVLVYIL